MMLFLLVLLPAYQRGLVLPDLTTSSVFVRGAARDRPVFVQWLYAVCSGRPLALVAIFPEKFIFNPCFTGDKVLTLCV